MTLMIVLSQWLDGNIPEAPWSFDGSFVCQVFVQELDNCGVHINVSQRRVRRAALHPEVCKFDFLKLAARHSTALLPNHAKLGCRQAALASCESFYTIKLRWS